MKCKICSGDLDYMLTGQRSPEHGGDYPDVTTLAMCPRCNVLVVESNGFSSWWVPDYKAQSSVGVQR